MSDNQQSVQATMKFYKGDELQIMSASTRKRFDACRASLAAGRGDTFWVLNYVQLKAMELLLTLKASSTNNNEKECGGSSNDSTGKIDAEARSNAEQEKAEDQKLASDTDTNKQECGGSSNVSTDKIDAEAGSSAEQETVEDPKWASGTNDNEQESRGESNGSADKIDAEVESSAVQETAEDPKWVPIGSGKTLVPRDKYNKMKASKSYTFATRRLLMAVFPRSVLATHSMTGKPSPAFPDKPAKMQLNPQKISDVIQEVLKLFQKVSETSVRNTITTKCADECKMLRIRSKKNASTK